MPSIPMMPIFRDFGGKPGELTSSEFLARVAQELSAARNASVAPPLEQIVNQNGNFISLDRGTLDLKRFRYLQNLDSGQSAIALTVAYDFKLNTCTFVGEEFTVYDAFGLDNGDIVGHEGDYGLAYFAADVCRWEVLRIQADTFNRTFPARIDSYTDSGDTHIYSWTEMEWTAATAAATVKSGGRTGVTASWPALEINNRTVDDDTIVWMRRGYRATSPAVAVVVKTTSGNNAGVRAAFSLYVDQATGGTFTLTFDGATTTAIAWNASGATVKAAIEATTGGLTLSTFSGSGTLASPWTFSVTSNAADHTISANEANLKDSSGFRFEMSDGGDGLAACDFGGLPGFDADAMNVVTVDADGCATIVHPAACSSPRVIRGGTP